MSDLPRDVFPNEIKIFVLKSKYLKVSWLIYDRRPDGPSSIYYPIDESRKIILNYERSRIKLDKQGYDKLWK